MEIESELGDEWLADRIVVITQLAEEIDRYTLELALRIVPVNGGRKGSAPRFQQPGPDDPVELLSYGTPVACPRTEAYGAAG